MKNLLNYKSLIKVAIILVVVALTASQMTEAYAARPPDNNEPSLDQHDADIKAAITTHDNQAQNNIVIHDGNMTTEHDALSTEHGKLGTKLDQILQGGGSGECPDSPGAWSKQLAAEDRFELVLGVGVDIGGGEILFEYQAVLDKETQLVWQRTPNYLPRKWGVAMSFCLMDRTGGRGGWRMPLMEELTSLLIGPYEFLPPLPQGHPFDISDITGDVWSATTVPDTNEAWTQDIINDGYLGSFPKTDTRQVWCVRGGQGQDGQ